MFRRRRFGGFRARRRRGRGSRRIPVMRTINHYEDDTSLATVATATETTMTIGVGVDDVSNRSTHIPDGSILRRISCMLRCTSIPTAATKFQAILWRRPGGHALSTPISNYFSTTDPLPEAALEIRRFKLHGPITVTKAASDFTTFKVFLRWRGMLRIRDGDDILVTVLQNSGGNLAFHSNNLLQYQTV